MKTITMRTPGSPGNGEERRLAPAVAGAARGHAAAVIGAENKAAFHHVRHHSHAPGVFQHVCGDCLVWRVHQLFQILSGAAQAVDNLRLLAVHGLARCRGGNVVLRTSGRP
jgi:hypothetical protein